MMYSFPDLKPVCCSMSSSNCCFLTCIQISQEAGQVVWYSHLLKNFPQFVVIHRVLFVVIQARLQWYMNLNFQMVKLDLEKAEEPEIKLPTFAGSWKKQESSRKTSISALLTMPKPLTVWIKKKKKKTVGNSSGDGIPDHLICFLRSQYAGQEATVRTGHEITDWFQIGKGICQGCIFSPCLFNLYAEHIMKNAGLHEAQVRIKIAGRNINNFRYAGDTTLMAEREE